MDIMLYNTSPYYNKQNTRISIIINKLQCDERSNEYNNMVKKKGEGGRIQPTPPQVSLEYSGGVAASNV